MADGERLGGFESNADDYDDYDDEAPAKPKRNAPAAKPAKPAAKTKRIFDEDADGNEIYSDDGGENWYFVED